MNNIAIIAFIAIILSLIAITMVVLYQNCNTCPVEYNEHKVECFSVGTKTGKSQSIGLDAFLPVIIVPDNNNLYNYNTCLENFKYNNNTGEISVKKGYYKIYCNLSTISNQDENVCGRLILLVNGLLVASSVGSFLSIYRELNLTQNSIIQFKIINIEPKDIYIDYTDSVISISKNKVP